MKLETLRKIFQDAIDTKMNYVGILVHMEGFNDNEVIINTRGNFKKKLEYYEKTYDENCIHKFSPTIGIVDVMSAEYFEDFEYLFEDDDE